MSATVHSSVQQVAIQRAITLLRAAKAEFAIRAPDGEVFGELPIAVVPKKIKVNDFVKMFPGYIDQIKGMQAGDILVWEVPHDKADAFRSCVSASAAQHVGKGQCISTVTDKGVELLRVE